MRIMIVDDEPSIRLALSELLQDEGHDVTAHEDARAALAWLQDEGVDLVISDLAMPGLDGLRFLEELRARWPEIPFVLMTAHGDERTAVRALREGAWDYVPKPFDNAEILALTRRAAEVALLRGENEALRRELTPVTGLLGDSEPMRELHRIVRRVAGTDATVLVRGESGSGKELVARALHAEGRRRSGPFVAVNCSAIPSELVESELFGHLRGAFTGADRDRDGLFRAAHGGTLFLDEVGDLAPAAQAKLLRVLEERAVTAVGGTKSTPVDVRLIAATHRPLEDLVRDGSFRDDLFYRLRVVEIAVPSLRERRADIPLLAAHFIDELARRHRRGNVSLSEAARRLLIKADWPGNVRQLRNALEQAVVLADGETIEATDLPRELGQQTTEGVIGPVDGLENGLTLAEARSDADERFTRSYLRAALERAGGNVSEAARILGMHRQSLQKMLKKMGLRP